MDAKCRVPTPNTDVIYPMYYLDLKQDGPPLPGPRLLGTRLGRAADEVRMIAI